MMVELIEKVFLTLWPQQLHDILIYDWLVVDVSIWAMPSRSLYVPAVGLVV
jgi:hypothetical protein